MIKFVQSLFFILCTLAFAQAQQVVFSGQVVDSKSREPLKGITVVLKDNQQKVISFKMTDQQGNFKLSTHKEAQNIYLEINHLGYKRKKIDMLSPVESILIPLEVTTVMLEDVEIKSRPRISQIGDTLSYDVSSFAKSEDRSIGDVLKRMPGIEVSESGQIKYLGKSISNFYIDGDDLLSDKYKIGTNTIKHNMVKDVQVLNNHEHMKVMKSKRYSDEVALNLVIKDEAKMKLSGQSKIGVGLPHQYDLEANTILFNKKYKGLNVLHANNVGRDLTNEVKGFNRQSILTKLGISPINNLLSLGTVGNPPIGQQHYLFNHSVGLNANNLFNLKNKWQIVSNLQAVYDKNTKYFSGLTQYYTPTDTFTFFEKQETEMNQKLASLSLKATKNEDNIFVMNTLQLEYEQQRSNGLIQNSDSPFDLKKRHEIAGFRNTLNYVPVLKNGNLIQLDWFVDYGNKPQHLAISPGIFNGFLNDSIPYTMTYQYVQVPTFSTNASVGYRMPKSFVNQYYSFNATIDDQQLKTSLAKEVNDVYAAIDMDSTTNNMHWQRSSFAFLASYDLIRKRFSSSLRLPIAYQHTLFKDPTYSLKDRQGKLLFTPSYSARFAVSRESDLSFSYSRANYFGNIENVYRGYIIRNYRSISNNASGINESSSDSFDFNFKSGKTLKLLFYSVGLNYQRSVSSTMLSNMIDNNASQTALVERENVVSSYGLSTSFDKYLFALSSTLKVRANIAWTDYNQLFNNALLPYQNTTYSLSPSIEAKLWKKLNVSYSASFNRVDSKEKRGNGALDREIYSVSQHMGFPVTLFSKVYFNLSARHLYNHQAGLKDINYIFIDGFVRYRFTKWRTDLDLNMTNLGDIKRFNTYQISANMESQNNYQLRGRMVVLKAVFNL